MIQIRTDSFDISEDFWKKFPSLKASVYFMKFKNEKHSSHLMWAFLYLIHPDSPFYSHPTGEEEILKMLTNEGITDIDLTKYAAQMAELEKMCLSELQRTMAFWETKLRERREWLLDQEYNMKDGPKLDKMMESTGKMAETYAKALQQLKSEKEFSNKTSESDNDDL
ncbi:MAG TPA: hypothetical protein DCY51_11250 [Bacteroidetes bacterium]|nr:hypothetical protein [Bacteroidota bacterium]